MCYAIRSRVLFYKSYNKIKLLFNNFRLKVGKRGAKVEKSITKNTKYCGGRKIMFYLDYAKQIGDRYILNFFADSEEDLKDVPTNKPYITRNGTNYGVPLETSVVTIIEKGVKVNYVLQNGEYIAGGDVAPVVGKLEATENKTYLAKDANLDGYSQVVVNVQPKLQEKTITPSKSQQIAAPDDGYNGLSQVTVAKIPDDYVIPTGDINITTNGTHNVSGKVNAIVAVPGKEEQEKIVTVTSNGSQDVVPEAGKVFSKVAITTNVPATPVEEKVVELALAAGDQILTPTSGKNFSKVTITKPATLLPENIKKGVVIAGVTGTYEVVAG